jgi:hypothetical protein
MTPSRNRKPIRLSVQTSFRVFLYLGFSVCVLSAIALLGWGGSWVAPMFGTIAFGIPAIIAYLTEQEHQQNLIVAREAQRQRGSGGGWDLDDDEDDTDPTVPPTPRERTR